MKMALRVLLFCAAVGFSVQVFNLPAPPTPIPDIQSVANLPAPPTPIPDVHSDNLPAPPTPIPDFQAV